METRKKKEIRELYGGRIGWGCEAVGIACCAIREPEVYCKKGNYFYTMHYQQSCHVSLLGMTSGICCT